MKLFVHPKIQTGLGLASNTYKKILEKKEITMRELLTWAAGRGFSWLEVRDPDVLMTKEELLDLKNLAEKLDMRLHYSWDNEDLFVELPAFEKGMENAAVLGEGTCCRVLLASNAVKGKKGYSKEEIEKLVPIIKKYVRQADKLGITLCFENSMEPIKGDGKEYYGMTELLEMCDGMCSTFDAANFTNQTTLVNPDEEELAAYYQTFSERIPYFHMKVTRKHELLDALETEADFDVFRLLDLFSQNEKMLVALEIPQQPDLIRMTEMVEKSIQVLEEGRR